MGYGRVDANGLIALIVDSREGSKYYKNYPHPPNLGASGQGLRNFLGNFIMMWHIRLGWS
jgi:hypothetical protein